MENVYNVLNRYLRGSTRFGTNEEIARFMLGYLSELPQLRLADVAQKCHVSTPSVIRFCRELGYEDYTDFKQEAIRYLRHPSLEAIPLSAPLALHGNEQEYEASVRSLLERDSEQSVQAMLAIDRPQLERLARDIDRYRYVYFFGFGMSGVIAEQIRVWLAQFGKIVFTLAEPPFDRSLTPDKAETLGIVITQHGRFLRQNDGRPLPYLRKNCTKTWVITQESAEHGSFPVDETLRLLGGTNTREDFHIMYYFEALLGATFQSILGQDAQSTPG